MTQSRVVINNLLNEGLALNIVKLGKNMLIINTGDRHYEGEWEGESGLAGQLDVGQVDGRENGRERRSMTNLALAPILEAFCSRSLRRATVTWSLDVGQVDRREDR
jgi:hypothetical protein